MGGVSAGNGKGKGKGKAKDRRPSKTMSKSMAKNAKKKEGLRMKKLANGGMSMDDSTGAFALVKGGGGKRGGKKGKLGKQPKKPTLDLAFAKMVETVMGERWNAAQRSLNLQQLLQDPRLSQWVDKGPGAMWQTAAFGDAVMKIIEGHCSTVVTLDLSNNMIRS